MSLRDDLLAWQLYPIDIRIQERYEVKNIVRGGMGLVCFCYDHHYHRTTVIKTPLWVDDEAMIARFSEEAEAWVRLERHRNIVHANAVEIIEGHPYIFVEHVAGDDQVAGDKYKRSDLRVWLNRSKHLSVPQVLDFGAQISAGMIHAARTFAKIGRPFVHCDLKPENILVNFRRVAKVTDFGLIKSLDDPSDKNFPHAGTPQYMSPEQFRGDSELDVRSDIYAFGCVIYELLTGRRPFVEGDRMTLRRHHLYDVPPSLRSFLPDISPYLSDIVARCLEKDAVARFSDFEELRGHLTRLYHTITGRHVPADTATELEAWDRISKGVSLALLGYRKDAVGELNRAIQTDSTILRRVFPERICRVLSHYSPPGKRSALVFLIYNVYGNISCQENIAAILSLLSGRYGLRLVAAEGGGGDYDLSFYHNLLDPARKLQTSTQLMHEGSISGAEFFAINTDKDSHITFFGADDQRLHNENTNVFIKNLAVVERSKMVCQGLYLALIRLKPLVYTRELWCFEQASESVAGTVEAFVTYLKDECRRRCIPWDKPNLKLWSKAAEARTRLNIARAQVERDELISELESQLTPEDMEGWRQRIQEHKMNEISDSEFYRSFAYALDKYLDTRWRDKFSNFKAFLAHVLALGEVDNFAVLEEIDTVKTLIRESIYVNADESTLTHYIEEIASIRDALAMKLDPHRAEHIERTWQNFDLTAVSSFIRQAAEKQSLRVVERDLAKGGLQAPADTLEIPKVPSDMFDRLNDAMRFFITARKRSKALIENTLNKMTSTNEPTAALIVGGFHGDIVMRRLRKDKIPHIVIAPEMELTAEDDQRYDQQIRGELTGMTRHT